MDRDNRREEKAGKATQTRGSRDMRTHLMDTKAALEKITSDRYKSLSLQHMLSVAFIPTA